MASFFSPITERKESKSGICYKKYHFEEEIRKNGKEERKKHLRKIYFGIGQHIKPLVDALPNSLPDLLAYILESQEYHKVISKLIIDRIYQTEIKPQINSQQSTQLSFEWKSFILPENAPDNSRQLRKWVYFFIVLVENEGTHAPHIFKKYFPLLRSYTEKFNQTFLLFDMINIIVRQKKLDWVPINQLVSIIQLIELSKQNLVSQQEAHVYLNLSRNYFQVARDSPKIRNRILKLLEQGSECFQRILPKTFFKICLTLTYHQNTQKYIDQFDGIQKKSQLFFHKSMFKGNLVRNLFRQISFSPQQKLRRICLNVLGNVIIEYQSTFIWVDQKLDPINVFQTQIKNTSNSMQTFYLLSEVFLLALIHIPYKIIPTIFQKQIDVLSLIQYILENIECKCQKEIFIKNLAEQSLWLFLDEGTIEIKQKISNKLIESQWRKFFQKDSDIIHQCYRILQIEP